MAKDKNSFVLYCDLIHTVRKLRKEDAGELLLHILEYVNDENPVTENPIVDIAFEPIKQSLKRDLKKYEERAERSRENGKKGGRPKTQKTQQVILKPRKPDSDSVSDSVINKEKNNKKEKPHDWRGADIDVNGFQLKQPKQ